MGCAVPATALHPHLSCPDFLLPSSSPNHESTQELFAPPVRQVPTRSISPGVFSFHPLSIPLGGHYYLHFPCEETEAQRGKVTPEQNK